MLRQQVGRCFLGKGGNAAAGYSFVRPPPANRFLTQSRAGGLRLREKHPIAARSRGMIRRDMGFFPGKGKTFIKVEVGTSPFYECVLLFLKLYDIPLLCGSVVLE